MNLQDLIEIITPSLFSSEKEDDKEIHGLENKIQEISRTISNFEASLIVSRDKEGLANDISEVFALINNFPYDSLHVSTQRIQKKYRQKFSKIIYHFELALKKIKIEIFKNFSSGRFDLELNASKEFFRLKNEVLEILKKYKIEKKGRPFIFLPFLLYIVPVVLAVLTYLLGVYIRLDRSTSLVQSKVINPHNAYLANTEESNKYELSEAYKDRFIQEFSKLYFGKPHRFYRFYNSHRKHRVVFKFVLKNVSKSNPLIISTVDAVVEYEKSQDFPWMALDVKPEVEPQISKDYIRFINNGIGPALNFEYEGITQSGIVRFKNSKKVLENTVQNTFMWGVIGISFDSCRHYDGEIAIQKVANEKLEKPLFFRIDTSRDVEVVETLTRLKEITSVSHQEAMVLKYTYHSIDNQSYQGEFQTRLPENLVYYVRRSNLLEYNPREGNPCDQSQAPFPDVPAMATSNASSPSLSRPPSEPLAFETHGVELAAAVAPNEVASSEKPEGVDTLATALELNLAALLVGEPTSDLKSLDTVINPGGFLFVYVTLLQPENGSYSMQVHVNDNELQRITFDSLVPVSQELRFRFPESLQYFETSLDSLAEED